MSFSCERDWISSGSKLERDIFFLGKVGVKIGLGGNFGYAVARDPVANILVELFTISTVYRVVNTFDILLKTSITAIILGC